MKVDITLLVANADNPRLIKDDKFKKLCKSIQDFPQMLSLRPIVVDEDYTILGGNMRYRALKHLGIQEVDITIAEGLSDEQKREFVIKDNAGYGEWDWDVLANEWSDLPLNDWGIDLPEEWVKQEEPSAEEDSYQSPDSIETDIVVGDLLEIGPHRLLCGDSTNADDVKKLLGDDTPILMVTDPPYGVSYDPNWRKEHNETKGFAAKTVQTGLVSNDDKADWAETYSLFTGNVAYVWHGGRHARTVQQNLEDCGFDIVCQIIWNKMYGVFGRGDYHWQHEPCWYAVRKGKTHNYQGDRTQTTVWDIKGFNPNGSNLGQVEEKTGHGTQKPLECMARPIRNNTAEGESVYDPFLGSGTTMAAAHQLNRVCFGLELNPSYCQIIVDRMRKLDPSLVVKRNGVVLSLSEIEQK